jgi:hypothetical protein
MEKYILYYNSFIDILLAIFKDEEIKKILSEIKLLSDEVKLTFGYNFNNSITNANFTSFLESKIKLVSHKNDDTLVISQSLFGNKLCLKDILNNQTTEIKKIIWLNLHTLYLNAEVLKPDIKQNKLQISKLEKLLNKKEAESTSKEAEFLNSEPLPLPEPKKKNNLFNFDGTLNDDTNNDTAKTIQQLLNVNVNNNTNDMLDDIVGSFQDILSGGNPMNGILGVSQKISQKYADQINNGDIELDKLMESITKKVPAIGEMMKMMPTDKQKSKQEQYVMNETFSTASVPLGNNDTTNKNMDIGNMLKMADGMGFIPQFGNTINNTTENPINIPGMENIQTLLGFVNKIEKSDNQDSVNTIKNEMDTFLQNNLGIDINKFNEDINKII